MWEIKCKLCNKVYSCKQTLKLHIKQIHEEGENVRCPFCLKMYRNAESLKSHIRGYHRETPGVECKICGKIFKKTSKLKTHLLYVHTPKVQCEICHKYFTVPKLKRHMEDWHMEDSEKRRTCETCGFVAASRDSLQNHIDRVHLNKRCPSRMHQKPRRFIDPKKPRVECEICHKSVLNRKLPLHIKEQHTEEGIQRRTCKICGFFSKSIEALRLHVNYVHLKLRTPSRMKGYKPPSKSKKVD